MPCGIAGASLAFVQEDLYIPGIVLVANIVAIITGGLILPISLIVGLLRLCQAKEVITLSNTADIVIRALVSAA